MNLLVRLLVLFSFVTLLLPDSTRTIINIDAPIGYHRIQYEEDSYPSYLRSIPLKSDNEIKKWDGNTLKSSWILYDVFAVLDIPLLFNEDLEQCADFSMRLWSEYLRNIDKLDQLSLFDYNGNRKSFLSSQKSFEKYLRWHMAFSNSHSIKRGAIKVESAELRPGDMFVQNETGGIGHVSVIVDAAKNSSGDKIFLIGFGYMPAQEFHIEKAENKYGVEGWFTLKGYQQFLNGLQFRRYGKPSLMRYR